MVKEQIIIGEREHLLLEKHLKTSNMSKHNNEKLANELKNAKVVNVQDIPEKAIILNSIVEIEETVSKRTFSFQIVLPEEADIKENKISVFTPMGIALIGYLEGSFVEWEMPNGIQKFKINKVEHPL